MTDKERYEFRKANCLCVQCGKPAMVGYVKCDKCTEKARILSAKYNRTEESKKRKAENHRKYIKDHYAKMKTLGLCKCGKKLAIGFSSCPECLEKKRVQKEKSRAKNREKYNAQMKAYHKNLYVRRKEQGLCPVCGKKLPEGYKYINCVECLAKKKKRETKPKIKRSEWIGYGLCYHCGKKPAMDGYKVCKECYDRDIELLKKANKSPEGIRAKQEYSTIFYRKMKAAKLEKEHRFVRIGVAQ